MLTNSKFTVNTKIPYESSAFNAGMKSFKLNDLDVESKTFLNNVISFFFGFMLFGCFVIVLKYYDSTINGNIGGNFTFQLELEYSSNILNNDLKGIMGQWL